MIKELLIVILGFIALIYGANQLIKGSSNIAKKFKLPNIIIGLTIVAIGTSLPELIITIASSTKESTDLIIGNILGSNVCNLLLVLGVMSTIRPVLVNKETRRIHIPILLLSTVLVFLIGLGVFGGEMLTITKTDGIILISLGLIYFSYPVLQEIKSIAKVGKEDIEQNKKDNSKIWFSLVNILIGSILLKYGGDFVVNGATSLAQILNISEKIIGLSILAIGTSLPELVTSIIAIIKNDEDIAVGNIIGSCIINLLFILGIGAIISSLSFENNFNGTIFLLIASIVLIWLYSLAEKDNKITKPSGITLVIIFVLYVIKLFL